MLSPKRLFTANAAKSCPNSYSALMRKTLLLSSLALMLFCTTPAVAQLKPGAWAPDIEVKSWMNTTDKWKSKKDKEIDKLKKRVSELEDQLKAA